MNHPKKHWRREGITDSNMKILVACPSNCATGGPEAIHQFVSTMDQLDGVDAFVWFWGASGSPMPEEYRHYGCRFVTDIPDNFYGVLVFPEIWANEALKYPGYVRAIWWLGVDAYASWTAPEERGAFLQDDTIVHIAQSEYARDFLKKLGVKRVLKCDDTVNTDFYADYDYIERGNDVLYNPTKATPFMQEIINACPGINFKPISGMTRAEVIDTMRHSKLYIDFGEFPGRERMPREAVLCGCCIITSKIGAAAYIKDFAHDYKFESKEGHIWAIVNRIHHVLENYDECRKDFDLFRDSLREDIKRIPEQCKEIVGVFREI